MWDAERYVQFADAYTRPFFDLIARTQRDDFARIIDLGCGPGDLTRAVLERWPQAAVVGVDSSEDMLRQARSGQTSHRLRFVPGDIATWQPDEPADLIISNAALQWVPDHDRLLPQLAAMLAPHGVLAVQMPDHFGMAVSTAIDEVIQGSRWRARLDGKGLHVNTVRSLTWYVQKLHELDFTVDAWETTYIRVWRGDNPVLEWMKATALRPMLSVLGPAETEDFLREVGEAFRRHYPRTGEVTLVPAKRMFFVATSH